MHIMQLCLKNHCYYLTYAGFSYFDSEPFVQLANQPLQPLILCNSLMDRLREDSSLHMVLIPDNCYLLFNNTKLITRKTQENNRAHY